MNEQNAPTPKANAATLTGAASGATGFPAAALAFRKILVPVDFSIHSRKTVQQAFAFATQAGADVILVHIVDALVAHQEGAAPQYIAPDYIKENSEASLSLLRTLSVGAPVKVEQEVRVGRPWKEIIDLAAEKNVDLIVIPTHGYTGIRHAMLGSVAEKVVRHAPCPVLVTRVDEADFDK